MCGDRALTCGEGGHSTELRPKIFRWGPAIVGFSGLLAIPQILQDRLEWPFPLNREPKNFLRDCNSVFRDSIIDILDSYDMEYIGTELLIAAYGHIIRVEDGIQITVTSDDIACSGIGMAGVTALECASGSPKNRLIKAQKAIAKHFPGSVGAPFDILSIKV